MKSVNVIVVIQHDKPCSWVLNILDQIDHHNCAQLTGIVIQQASDVVSNTHKDTHTDSPTNAAKPLLRKLANKIVYGIVDRPRYKFDSLTPKVLPERYRALIGVNPTQCDIVLHLGDPNLPTNNAPKATTGVWVIRHDQLIGVAEKALLKRSDLLWIHIFELIDAQADLNNCGDNANLRRIASHSLATQTFSGSDIKNQVFGSLPGLILSRLNWIANGHKPYEYEQQQIDHALFAANAFSERCDYKPLSNPAYLFYAINLLIAQNKQRVHNKTSSEQWQLGFLFTDGSTDNGKNKKANDLAVNDFITLTPPPNRIWADPHTIMHNGQCHVFFEDMDLDENVGIISTAVLTQNGFEQPPVSALQEPHHLSYPYLFEHDKQHYMIPETASSRSVNLYKATHFPDKWSKVKSLLTNINAADTTLHFHDGLWWMFTNGVLHPTMGERDELLLFYTNDVLNGEWQAHPLNPVLTGVDRARMAGPLFEQHGKLLRPSQYGAVRYGYGTNFSVITKLSTTDYEEKLTSRIQPERGDGWMGCHTTTHNENTIVVDRLQRVKKAASVT